MEFFQANIKFYEVVVQLLAFTIVFLTLKKLAWKPILKGLEARRERIQSEFDKIEASKKEIEALRQDYTAHLQKIDEESRAKLQEAIDEGRRVAREIQEKARADAQSTFEKAKENLGLEVDKARLVLRREIADLAIGVSEKIMKEKMTDAKQQEKILGMIEELDPSSPRKGEGR
ncbi:MAG TPA: F0F1 ATP synthase subunit B [bacterium]|nr:F0F1 ATP synthase subunit B [bacterium]